jgi:hypothetical protein
MRPVTFIGVVLMAMGSVLAWIVAPIRGELPGQVFPWIALLTGLAGGVAWYYRLSRLLAVCGAAGLGLCGFAIVHLALVDSLFWLLVEENGQFARISSFSQLYFPLNEGLEPWFSPILQTETISDRLGDAIYFMGRGWRCCCVGGVLTLVGCLLPKGKSNIRWTVSVTLLILTVGLGGDLFKGLAAQYYFEIGDRKMASGLYEDAIAEFQAAQRMVPQFAMNRQLNQKEGEAHYHLGALFQPSARLYLGNRYFEQQNYQTAVSELLLAVQDAPSPLKETVQKVLALTYVHMGLTYYRKSEFGSAVGLWERAVAVYPREYDALYFLTKAYFDQGRYEQSVAVGRLLLSQSYRDLLNANVQSNLGDAYWKLGDFAKARVAYERSIELDSYANFRIFLSLGGT